jgi:hypothetical protein
VNWYIRRADQLGKNIGFGWGVNDRNANTKYNGEGRDYGKERAICNLQFLDQAQTHDSPITGLMNNKFRFTILPKPYVHIPNIAEGEAPWRFKKMLFDAQGNYDPNGKYTFTQSIGETVTADTHGNKVIQFTGLEDNPYVVIDIKSGAVVIGQNVDNEADRKKLVKNLFECYPGLTVFEFNYDYVMGMKLFDAKVIATTLLDSLINTRLGISATFGMQSQEATERIREIIKNIINSDDSTISDCFYTFDNSKYESLLRKSEEKRARNQRFGNVTKESSTFENVQEILKEYSANAAYCCYLHYENPKVRQDIFMPTYYNKKDKLRSLGEPKGYCYGLSKEGYDKIKDVIKELKKETGIDELYIDYRAKRLKYYLLNILIIILAVL